MLHIIKGVWGVKLSSHHRLTQVHWEERSEQETGQSHGPADESSQKHRLVPYPVSVVTTDSSDSVVTL